MGVGNTVKEHLYIDKTADESVSSSNVLQDDNELLVAVAANEIVDIAVDAFYNAGAGGIAVSMNGPAAPTYCMYNVCLKSTTGIASAGPQTAYNVASSLAGASAGIVMVHLYIVNGANAGNVVLRWAQNASNAAATTVYRGGAMMARRHV